MCPSDEVAPSLSRHSPYAQASANAYVLIEEVGTFGIYRSSRVEVNVNLFVFFIIIKLVVEIGYEVFVIEAKAF